MNERMRERNGESDMNHIFNSVNIISFLLLFAFHANNFSETLKFICYCARGASWNFSKIDYHVCAYFRQLSQTETFSHCHLDFRFICKDKTHEQHNDITGYMEKSHSFFVAVCPDSLSYIHSPK